MQIDNDDDLHGDQRSNVVNIVIVCPTYPLVSGWALGPKVCMHHFGCGGINEIKGILRDFEEKNETF